MGLGGGMDESFEDPGTFDDDDEDGQLVDGEELDAGPTPDLSGLLSVSPLVRFPSYFVCLPFSFVLCRRAYKARARAQRRSRGLALPVVTCRSTICRPVIARSRYSFDMSYKLTRPR